ncbi:MAG: bifunctional ornithine acetyltransferase/N-acetylglutamate synthase [Clostridia bacterium]|nr:bifunctional ornithine acetyltransferase/N-acetylglutamate synthase [Clostridia bacterium]
MRKNAVNRQITPIEGGVCAPSGFSAGGAACGIRENGELDLAVILSEKRCPIACVFSTAKHLGAPVVISKKNVKSGYARAIVANNGVANVFLPDGERLAQRVCDLTEKNFGCLREEVVVASTGKIGRSLSAEPFEQGLGTLKGNLQASAEGSSLAAKALSSIGAANGQLSYSFELGDVTCRIGALFKGSMHVAPNMATTLVFLTTDVCISPKMLQSALSATVKDTLNMLSVDGQASPNDTVCIMANGRAKNWSIDRVDTDYNKFVFALRAVLKEICLVIAAGEDGSEKAISCTVTGVKSKQLARTLAKKLLSLRGVREMLSTAQDSSDVESVIYALAEEEAVNGYDKIQISVRSENGVLLIFEDGRRLPCAKKRLQEVLMGVETGLFVALNEGNYSSCAYGRV